MIGRLSLWGTVCLPFSKNVQNRNETHHVNPVDVLVRDGVSI